MVALPNKKNFYPEFEGTRGIAISLVVLFHFMPKLCPFGYYGVDVFMVMSGFFLAKGVMDCDSGTNFNLVSFCRKKVLRLFPPLLFMMLCIMPIALMLIPYRTLSMSISTGLAALLGYANAYLDSTANTYFGPSSKENLFTHTWYLSAIIQAYAIYACFFFLSRRLTPKWRWCFLLFMGALSLLYANSRSIYSYFFPLEPLYVLYYSTPARFFEFVLGSMGVLCLSDSKKNITPWFGYAALLLILVSSFALPGVGRPLVVFCTALLICLVVKGSNNVLLSSRLMRWLGKYSYSIYLWHWPIFVIWNYYYEESPWYATLGVVLISVLCGVAAYYVAEKPKWNILLIACIWSGLFCGCELLKKDKTYAEFFRKDPLIYMLEKDFTQQLTYCKDYPSDILSPWAESGLNFSGQNANLVVLGDVAVTPSFVVMGDSHCGAFRFGLHDIMLRNHRSGYYMPFYMTPFDDRMAGRNAFRFSGEAANACHAWLAAHPELHTVVIIQRWSIRLKDFMNDEGLPLHYDGRPVTVDSGLYDDTAASLERYCANLNRIGKKVVLLTEVPPVIEGKPYGYVSHALAVGKEIDQTRLECTPEFYFEKFRRQYGTLRRLERKGLCRLIPVEQAAFEQGDWKAVRDYYVYMNDDNHVSPVGAIYLARKQEALWLQALDE